MSVSFGRSKRKIIDDDSPRSHSPGSLKDDLTKRQNKQNEEDFTKILNPLHFDVPQVNSNPDLPFEDDFFKKIQEDTKQIESLNLRKKKSEKENIQIQSSVDKEGWIVKEGRIVKSWKKRWFVLSGSTLAYYTAKRNKLKGVIELECCEVKPIKRTDGRECLVLNVLKDEAFISQEGEKERTLYFDVPTENLEERNSWLVAINNKIALLKYQKKMRKKGLMDNIDVLEFFDQPDARELIMDRSADQESVDLDAIQAISEPLRYHTKLQVLSLKGCRIGNVALKELCKALQSNKSITKMDLSGNRIHKEGIEALAKILPTNQTITELNLSFNKIDDESMIILSKALEENSVLKKIGLNHNQIGDEGIKSLINALKKNKKTSIHHFDFSHNLITDKGVEEIAKLLQTDYPVEILDLGYNKIGNAGASLLSKALVRNKNLNLLNLEFNEIGYDGTKDLAFMIVKNTKISTMVLSGNRLGEQAFFLLANTNMAFPELELSTKYE